MLLDPIPQGHQGRLHHSEGQLVIIGVLEVELQATIRKLMRENSTQDKCVAAYRYPLLEELVHSCNHALELPRLLVPYNGYYFQNDVGLGVGGAPGDGAISTGIERPKVELRARNKDGGRGLGKWLTSQPRFRGHWHRLACSECRGKRGMLWSGQRMQ